MEALAATIESAIGPVGDVVGMSAMTAFVVLVGLAHVLVLPLRAKWIRGIAPMVSLATCVWMCGHGVGDVDLRIAACVVAFTVMTFFDWSHGMMTPSAQRTSPSRAMARS